MIDPGWVSKEPIDLRIYDWDGLLMQYSDKFDRSNFIQYEIDRETFTDYYPWSTCDMNSCTHNATASEIAALIDLYNSTNGDWWRINENWLVGDPCTNHWYGVTCNTRGNVIAFYMFENHLDGFLPDSFSDLVHLRHLTIANDGREHEGVPNPHKNSIYLYNANVISKLRLLEEINMQHLNMTGILGRSLLNLVNLKYLNLGFN